MMRTNLFSEELTINYAHCALVNARIVDDVALMQELMRWKRTRCAITMRK